MLQVTGSIWYFMYNDNLNCKLLFEFPSQGYMLIHSNLLPASARLLIRVVCTLKLQKISRGYAPGPLLPRWCEIIMYKNGVYALVKYNIFHGYPGTLLDFQNSEGRILQGGKGKYPGVETPVGAMLWDICNIVLCFMVRVLHAFCLKGGKGRGAFWSQGGASRFFTNNMIFLECGVNCYCFIWSFLHF